MYLHTLHYQAYETEEPDDNKERNDKGGSEKKKKKKLDMVRFIAAFHCYALAAEATEVLGARSALAFRVRLCA